MCSTTCLSSCSRGFVLCSSRLSNFKRATRFFDPLEPVPRYQAGVYQARAAAFAYVGQGNVTGGVSACLATSRGQSGAPYACSVRSTLAHQVACWSLIEVTNLNKDYFLSGNSRHAITNMSAEVEC